MRSPEKNTEVTQSMPVDRREGAVRSRPSNYHAGVDSGALRASVVVSPLSSQPDDAYLSSPIDAAIGIKNGLLLGGAFWLLAFALFSLVRYLT